MRKLRQRDKLTIDGTAVQRILLVPVRDVLGTAALVVLFALAGGTPSADVAGAVLVTAVKRRKRVAITAVVGVLADCAFGGSRWAFGSTTWRRSRSSGDETDAEHSDEECELHDEVG